MKCEKCGNAINEGQTVCAICGTPVGDKVKENKKSSDSKPKRQKVHRDYTSFSIIFGLLLSIVCLIVFGLLFFYKVFTTPKIIFMNTLDKISDTANANISSFQKDGKYKIYYSSNTVLNSDDEIAQLLSNLNISSDLTVYYGDVADSFQGSLGIKYGNEYIINQDKMYGLDSQVYLLGSQSSKYISMNNKYSEYLKNHAEKFNAYKTVMNELKKALRASLKDSYFKQYKETININNQDIEVNKNELILNNNNIKEFETNLYTYLAHSKKYISALAQIKTKQSEDVEKYKKKFKKKKKEIQKDLDETVKDLKKEGTTVTISDIVIDIYTKGLKNEFVKLSVNRGYGTSDIISVVCDENNQYNIQVNLNNKYFNLKISKEKIPEKTSYILNYNNGYEDLRISIEYSYDRQAELEDFKANNSINYETIMDKYSRELIRNSVLNDSVKTKLDHDKQKVIDWFNGAKREFKPKVEVGEDDGNQSYIEPSTSDSDGQDDLSPAGEGSIEWMQSEENQ